MDLRSGGDSFDWFFLAMAHWRLEYKEEARRWYDRAVGRMEKNKPHDEQLRRFRAKAAELLGLQGERQTKDDSALSDEKETGNIQNAQKHPDPEARNVEAHPP